MKAAVVRSFDMRSPFSLTYLLLGMAVIGGIGCRSEDLIHDLTEKEANILVSRLIAAGIEPEKQQDAGGAWKLAVKSEERNKALELMTRERLLRGMRGTSEESKTSMFASKDLQQLDVERRVARELEIMLETIPGVLEARARLRLRHGNGRDTDKAANDGSGAVILIVSEVFKASPDNIAALAAGASGLRPSQVEVFLSPLASKHEES